MPPIRQISKHLISNAFSSSLPKSFVYGSLFAASATHPMQLFALLSTRVGNQPKINQLDAH